MCFTFQGEDLSGCKAGLRGPTDIYHLFLYQELALSCDSEGDQAVFGWSISGETGMEVEGSLTLCPLSLCLSPEGL